MRLVSGRTVWQPGIHHTMLADAVTNNTPGVELVLLAPELGRDTSPCVSCPDGSEGRKIIGQSYLWLQDQCHNSPPNMCHAICMYPCPHAIFTKNRPQISIDPWNFWILTEQVHASILYLRRFVLIDMVHGCQGDPTLYNHAAFAMADDVLSAK